MFTADEFSMMQDAHLMPAKHRILEKTALLFGTLGKSYIDILSEKRGQPQYYKITKGDHLEAQPWCLLDVPKLEHTPDGCYFRILFWWGQKVRHMIYAPASYQSILKKDLGWEIVKENIWNQRSKPSPENHIAENCLVRFQKDFPILSLREPELYDSSFQSFLSVYIDIHGLSHSI